MLKHFFLIHCAELKKNPSKWPGELGKPVVISSDEEILKNEKFKLNQFNLLASDRIALNRSLSDVRMEGWEQTDTFLYSSLKYCHIKVEKKENSVNCFCLKSTVVPCDLAVISCQTWEITTVFLPVSLGISFMCSPKEFKHLIGELGIARHHCTIHIDSKIYVFDLFIFQLMFNVIGSEFIAVLRDTVFRLSFQVQKKRVFPIPTHYQYCDSFP